MSTLACFKMPDGRAVRTFGTNDEPWFSAADVCECLDLKNVSQSISSLDDDEKGDITINDVAGRPNKCLTVNESGLYALIGKSRKDSAKRFRKWVTGEVLPAIRKTGRYDVQEQARAIAFKHFLLELPSDWRRTFSDDFLAAALGVYGLDYVKARTQGFLGTWINEYVYNSLVDGLSDELKSRRSAIGSDSSKLHQFLKQEARDKLTEHLIAVKTLALNCQGRPDDFREGFQRVFRGRNQLMLGLCPKKRRAIA